MAKFLGQRTRVEFNGYDVSHLTGCSVGTMGIVHDTFQTLRDPYDHDIDIKEEATGSFDIVAADSDGANNNFKEMMHMITGYEDLFASDNSALATGDTADKVLQVDTTFEATDEVTYTVPRFLTVFRRIDEGGSSYATFDSTNDTAWIKFRAQGERISALALVIKTSTTDDHTFTVSICPSQDDTGAVPKTDDTLVSGMTASDAHTISGSTHNGTNKWYAVTPHSTWSDADRLTIGSDYWLRVTKTGGSTGNFQIVLADNQHAYGHLLLNSAVDAPTASAQVNKEIVHYLKMKATEGLKVDVFDYVDTGETNGIKYTFNNVVLDSVSPSFANAQATRASIGWHTFDWTLTGI